MRDLLKIDLKRVCKDTLFLVLLILAGVFAFVGPILMKAAFSFINIEEIAGNFVFAKSMFFDSFSVSSNMGIITPILLTVVICKDVSHGTIRNKIISGHSRTSIYLSRFITLCVYMVGIMLVHALLTLGFSLMFFNYQPKPFEWVDFWYILVSVGFNVLVYLLISALLAFLTVSMKTAGLSIVLYISALFLFIIVGVVTNLSVSLSFEEPSKFLLFLDNANAFSSSIIGAGSSYTTFELLSLTLPNLFFAGAFFSLGLLIFNKRDLK